MLIAKNLSHTNIWISDHLELELINKRGSEVSYLSQIYVLGLMGESIPVGEGACKWTASSLNVFTQTRTWGGEKETKREDSLPWS